MLPICTSIVVFLTLTNATVLLQSPSFSLETIPGAKALDGPTGRHKAYLKYGIKMPGALQKRQAGLYSSADVTGSVLAESEKNDVEYLSRVDVGGQTLNLNIDTGSWDL
jgi:hypothetical protein